MKTASSHDGNNNLGLAVAFPSSDKLVRSIVNFIEFPSDFINTRWDRQSRDPEPTLIGTLDLLEAEAIVLKVLR